MIHCRYGRQLHFFGPAHGFDLGLPAGGRRAAVTAFEIDHLQRLPSPEILRAGAIGMLTKPPVNIRGNPGIERIVRAADDVHLPVHGLAPANRAVRLVSLRLALRFLTAIPRALGGR